LNCLCRSPYGPDLHTMLWCSNCRKWFHKDCSKVSKSNKSIHTYPGEPRVNADGGFPCLELRERDQKEFLNTLRFLAHCQIAKGQEHGVVGNFRYVLRAKNLLQQVISDGENFKVPSDWMEHLGLTENTKLLNEPWRICPTCGV
jgi:hypothetical protein